MYPKEQRNPTEKQRYQSFERNPEAAAARGLWSDEKFLERVGSHEFNKQLKTTQFADFHGHAGSSEPSSTTIEKGTGSTKKASKSRSTIPTALGRGRGMGEGGGGEGGEKPFISQTFISKRGCSATIAIVAQDNHGNGKNLRRAACRRRN